MHGAHISRASETTVGTVYLFLLSDGRLKVGFTQAPLERRAAQVGAVPLWAANGTLAQELRFHAGMRGDRPQRAGDEGYLQSRRFWDSFQSLRLALSTTGSAEVSAQGRSGRYRMKLAQVGRRLRRARMLLGLSMRALARRSSVDATQISRLERGATIEISAGTLFSIMEAMELDPRWVWTGLMEEP